MHRQVKQCAQASHGKALIWTLGPDSFFPLWARLHGEEGREVGGVCSVRRVTLLTIAGVFLEPKAGVAAGLLHSLEQEAERHKSWSDLPYPALFCFSPCLLPSYLSQQLHSFYSGEDSLEHMQSWGLVYWEGLVRADEGDMFEGHPKVSGGWKLVD